MTSTVAAVVALFLTAGVSLAQETPPRDVPHAFTLTMPLFGGLTITTTARNQEACELARRATHKRLLQDVAGTFAYDLGRRRPTKESQ